MYTMCTMQQVFDPLASSTSYLAVPSDENCKKLVHDSQSSNKSKEAFFKTGKNRVLLFSGMPELALYRAEALRGSGFNVLVPRSKDDAILAIKHASIDVVVLTYTLPNETVHELADLLREFCPECRLVVISETGRTDRKIAPDLIVLAAEGPIGLIEALRRLTKPN